MEEKLKMLLHSLAALSQLECLLAGNPDFIITSLPDLNFGVQLHHPMARASFGMSREMASDPATSDKERTGALRYMHKVLVEQMKKKMTSAQVKRELEELYGKFSLAP